MKVGEGWDGVLERWRGCLALSEGGMGFQRCGRVVYPSVKVGWCWDGVLEKWQGCLALSEGGWGLGWGFGGVAGLFRTQ